MQNDLYYAGALHKIKIQQQITYTIDYKFYIVYSILYLIPIMHGRY